MGALKHLQSATKIYLPGRCLVGRSHLCQLRLNARNVSGEHALLRWLGPAWGLSDLGSRNGTFVDGQRIPAGGHTVLTRGCLVSFGDVTDPWALEDDAPPVLMAVDCDSGETVCAPEELLVLPDGEQPLAVVYRHASGAWVLEQDGASSEVADQAILRVAGGRWRLHAPTALPGTWEPPAGLLSIENLTLSFLISSDEEYVQVLLHAQNRTINLHGRSHHYPLLILARARLQDQARGVPSSDQGWMYQTELQTMLKMDEKHLNISIHRARRQIIDTGITDGARIVERRIGTGLLRIGVAQIVLKNA